MTKQEQFEAFKRCHEAAVSAMQAMDELWDEDFIDIYPNHWYGFKEEVDDFALMVKPRAMYLEEENVTYDGGE